MIFNLVANQQNLALQNSDCLKVANVICKLSLVIVAVALVCDRTFLSDSYAPKSTIFSGPVPAASRSLGEFMGLKIRPSDSTFESSNFQTSIKDRIPQRICIDQYGNEYPCP